MINEKQGADIITKVILNTLTYDDLVAVDPTYRGIRDFFALDFTENILLSFGYKIHIIITTHNRMVQINTHKEHTVYEIDSIPDRDNYVFSSYKKID